MIVQSERMTCGIISARHVQNPSFSITNIFLTQISI